MLNKGVKQQLLDNAGISKDVQPVAGLAMKSSVLPDPMFTTVPCKAN